MKQPAHPLPANVDSERLVLGYLLLDNEAWGKVETLTESSFSLSSHKRIFSCIRSRLSIGRPIDLILLADAMLRQKELDSVGGPAYLSFLTEGIPVGAVAVEAHVALLQEKEALRRIIGICHDASFRAYAQDHSTEILQCITEQIQPCKTI